MRSAFGVKPAGAQHSVTFGRSGATILSFNIRDPQTLVGIGGLEPARWGDFHGLARFVPAVMACRSSGEDLRELLNDMIAAGNPSVNPKPAAAAVARIREALRDAPGQASLTALAHGEGIHRGHLSRSFKARFGIEPSLYRLRCMMASAIRRVLEGRPLAEAALSVGFADQSHFTRTLKAQTGLTPAALRAQFVTSVQETGRARR